MNNAFGVGKGQALRSLCRYPDGLLQRQRSVCIFDEFFNVTTAHDRLHHVRISVFFAQVIDRHDAGVCSHPAHGLRFSSHPLPTYFIQALGLDDCKSNVTVQDGVVGEVDLLLAAFTEEPGDGVATAAAE